jgi:acetylornithine deacetylase/succinyl-diaminopimelate desuccinylase-like protein
MKFNREKFADYIQQNRERFIAELGELIAIESVAADKRDTQTAADWVTARLEKLGAQVRQYPLPNSSSPIVYAEMGTGPRALMIYNHYDVQPEAPLDDWHTPPFTLTVKDGVMYGRGVCDDKGELVYRLQAVEAWLATQGDLPLQLKFVIEGEEEVGSVNLDRWAEEHQAMLSADGCLWEGGGYDDEGRVLFAEGCKGIAYFELHIKTAGYDLHSAYAPMTENAAWRLIWALASMKDTHDRITIDGYWEHVPGFDQAMRERVAQLPFAPEKIRQNFGLKHWINGMSDAEALQRYYLEPTMTIAGFESGYTAQGTKTIVPATAMCKLDFRLVPDLTPNLVESLVRAHLDRRGFTDIEIKRLAGEHPAMNPGDSAIRQAAIRAAEKSFQQTPTILPWFAGSGPMYPLSVMLGIPAISGGATMHPKARIHAPNENIFVEDYFKSMNFMGEFIYRFAQER